MKTSPNISICMAMHNAGAYIKDCIDSILCQSYTDFELIIVDDGSTDNSVSIVERYDDQRIRLITCCHNYVASLNRCIIEANGKYIARMDADDIMTKDRIRVQYEFMERHPTIDLMFGGIELISDKGKSLGQSMCTLKGHITLSEISEGCCLAHPTAFMRTSSIAYKKHMLYNSQFEYAEDYNLWVELLIDGLIIYNSDNVFGYYRRHDSQVSVINQSEQIKKSHIIRDKAIRYHSFLTHQEFHKKHNIPDSANQLTIVIPFLNEQEEVKNTITSIRATVGNSVDIIVINDNSNDDYDYISDLSGLDVVYIENNYRIGAALSKEKGVKLVKTPFFLILDAHMRLYSSTWAADIIAELKSSPNRLLCCQTIVLEKDEKGLVTQSVTARTAIGAYMTFETNSYIPGIKWNNSNQALSDGNTIAIPCVLGAGYASSKQYWDKIAGMRGLTHYGCEEVFISTKAWLEGGGCYLLSKLAVGHIYRKKFPYKVHSSQNVYNYLLIADTLFPTSDQSFVHAVAWKLNPETYFRALERIRANQDEILRLKHYFKSFNASNYESIRLLNDSCSNNNNLGNLITIEEIVRVCTHIQESTESILSLDLAQKTACLLCLLGYYHRMGEHTIGIEKTISHIWDNILASLSDCKNFAFLKGVSGCGWLLIYAKEQGLIDDCISSELNQIDSHLNQCAPERISDLSLASGLGGVYAYVVTRLGYNRRHNICNNFNETFINELSTRAVHAIHQASDWRTFNFIRQFIKRDEVDWSILPPRLIEIVDLPKIIPSDPEYWDYSIFGVSGNVISFLTR